MRHAGNPGETPGRHLTVSWYQAELGALQLGRRGEMGEDEGLLGQSARVAWSECVKKYPSTIGFAGSISGGRTIVSFQGPKHCILGRQ